MRLGRTIAPIGLRTHRLSVLDLLLQWYNGQTARVEPRRKAGKRVFSSRLHLSLLTLSSSVSKQQQRIDRVSEGALGADANAVDQSSMNSSFGNAA